MEAPIMPAPITMQCFDMLLASRRYQRGYLADHGSLAGDLVVRHGRVAGHDDQIAHDLGGSLGLELLPVGGRSNMLGARQVGGIETLLAQSIDELPRLAHQQ